MDARGASKLILFQVASCNLKNMNLLEHLGPPVHLSAACLSCTRALLWLSWNSFWRSWIPGLMLLPVAELVSGHLGAYLDAHGAAKLMFFQVAPCNLKMMSHLKALEPPVSSLVAVTSSTRRPTVLLWRLLCSLFELLWLSWNSFGRSWMPSWSQLGRSWSLETHPFSSCIMQLEKH